MTPAPPPQPSKGSRGCLVALAVFGGLVAVSCLVASAFAWRAAQSGQGKKFMDVVGKGVVLASKGISAPGTKELREAGCSHAMVMDMPEVLDLAKDAMDAGSAVNREAFNGVVVMCQAGRFEDPPDCDAVAKIYVQAVHPTLRFLAIVQRAGEGKPRCQGFYGIDGLPAPGLK